MGRMKDFVMWLEEKGYAEWNDHTESYEYTSAYNPQTALDEYRQDSSWHRTPTTENNENAQ